MVRVAVTGADGRMGREVVESVADRDACEVAFAVNRSPVSDPPAGVDVADAAEFPSLLSAEEPDVVVDFTGPASCVDYVSACAEAGVPFVTGTTGFDEEQEAALHDASDDVAVLHASNFARGVAALRRAVTEAVAALPGYDIELVETHHNGKRDAPSGTAKTILDDIDDVRGDAERVHGREGEQPRDTEATPGEVGVHALRAGDVTGEHEVTIAGNHELVSVTHRAESRGVFAAGAVDAALWLAGRDAGWYDFGDVLDAGGD